LDVRDGTDTENKPRQSLRDAAPLELDAHGSRKDSEKKHSGHHEVPRSRPYSQVPKAFIIFHLITFFLLLS